MELQGYLTGKGLALTTKLLTGETLEITRVVAGAGQTDSPVAATTLPQCKQTLAVNTPTRSGNTATIPATLVAAQAETDYTLTELGVYAKDPYEGEILYKVYQLQEPVAVRRDSRLVLRFYLEETVSQALNVAVACSPSGLITETVFAPVRDVVQSTAADMENVALEASELQAYLDALPRLLKDHHTILVSGSLDGDLTIHDFHGSGRIQIRGSQDCTLCGCIRIVNCDIPVELYDLTIQAPDGMDVNSHLLMIELCQRVWVEGCTFIGKEAGVCIRADMCSHAVVSHCAISRFYMAVMASGNSMVSVVRTEAGNFVSNTYGVYTYRGGIALLDSTVPDLLGGGVNAKDGGIIVKGDGTLL